MKIENVEIRVAKKVKRSFRQYIRFEKVHRLIKFNKKAWLKPYIYMNIDLKKQKMILKKIFLGS